MKKIINTYPILFLGICILLIYAPLFSGMFSPKNDNIIYFLSTRFNISSAIQNGEIPFWSNNIYFGLPLHSDMQSGFWNPIVWLLSLFGRYNVSTLVIEIYVYLFISAVGIFKLSKLYHQPTSIAIFLAISYITCGFYTDVIGQNIGFLIAGSYIPLLVYSILRFYNAYQTKYLILSIICFFLLFGSSYPSFTIITLYGLFFIFLWKLFYNKTRIAFLRQNFILGALILITCTPILYSYWEYLEYYGRGNGALSYKDATSNSLTIQSLLSAFYPFATTAKEGLGTDAMMRNIFVGLIIVFPFLRLNQTIKNKSKLILLLALILMLCLSLGNNTYIYHFFYNYIPFFQYFRHPANFRLFFILVLLFFTIKYLNTKDLLLQKSIVQYFFYCAALLWLIVLLFNFSTLPFFDYKNIFYLFENSTIQQGVFLQGLLLFSILLINIFFFKKKLFFLVQIGVVCTFAFIQTFKTVVSKKNNNVINKTIKDIQINKLLPNNNNTVGELSRNDSAHFDYIGNASYYKDYPTYSRRQTTPTVNSEYLNWINNPLNETTFLNSKLVGIYPLGSENNNIVHVNRLNFKDNKIQVDLTSAKDTLVYIVQNKHHNLAIANGNKNITNIEIAGFPFIVIPIQKGTNLITIEYQPKKMITLFVGVFAFVLLLLLGVLLVHFRKKV